MKISVCIITYNQEKFIGQALDGVLLQKTDFPLEITIGDDHSTDKTATIIKKFQKKFPKIIRAKFYKKNIGMLANWMETMNCCHGKYIAVCEGDDYWTDPRKLQKQVDFLEQNSDFNIVSHNVSVKDETKGTYYNKQYAYLKKNVYTIEEILQVGSCGATCSLVFRRDAVLPYPRWFSQLKSADWPTQILACRTGKMAYLPQIMAVYRQNHQGGSLKAAINQAKNEGKDFVGVAYRNILKTVSILDKNLSYKYSQSLQNQRAYCYFNLALAYYEAGQKNIARGYALKALQLVPQLPLYLSVPRTARTLLLFLKTSL